MKTGMNNLAGKKRRIQALFIASVVMISLSLCKTNEKTSTATTSNGKQVTKNKTVKEFDINDISDAEFSGFYKIAGDPICRINLTIKKVSSTCSYTFSGDTFTSSGTITVRSREGQTLLYFNGTKCGDNGNVLTGTYADRTITIYNFSGANTRVTCFKECDSRYLRFVKN